MTTRCYAWPLTVRDGDDLHLHVSTGYPQFGVRLLRYGRHGDGRERAVRPFCRAAGPARPA